MLPRTDRNLVDLIGRGEFQKHLRFALASPDIINP